MGGISPFTSALLINWPIYKCFIGGSGPSRSTLSMELTNDAASLKLKVAISI